jgi:ABC-type multidrug transport system fused ATPase/permease subunit
MNLIEMALPIAAWLLLQSKPFRTRFRSAQNNEAAFTTCLAQLALISMGSSYLAVTIPFTVSALYLIQKFYLRTSRQLRLLDLEARSPMYQHFTETVEGLATIRALHQQASSEEEAIKRLDFSQKPYYLMQCIQRWLTLILDLTISVLAVALVTMAFCIPNSSDPRSIGVALSTLLGFNMSLQQVITYWTQAETSIGSIARIKSFSEDTPNENSNSSPSALNRPWPHGGEIDVRELKVVYRYGALD